MTTRHNGNTGIFPTRRSFIAGASAAGAALLGGVRESWAADEATLLAAAKKEGPIVVYTSNEPSMASDLIEGFKKKYGLDANFVRMTSTQLAQRFVAEQEVNQQAVDVIAVSERPIIAEGARRGWFADPADVPAFKTWDPSGIINGVGVLQGRNLSAIAWNTNLLPKGIARNEDLLDPALKGKVMISDPRTVPTNAAWYVLLADMYGDEFIRKLGQQAVFSPSSVPGMQQVAAGAMAVYSPVSKSVVTPLQEAGAPVAYTFIHPTLSAYVMSAVTKGAPHPNAARLYVNHVMSVEGQTVIANRGSLPTLPGIPGLMQNPPAPPPDIDADRLKRETERITKLFGLG